MRSRSTPMRRARNGDALITFESALGVQSRVVKTDGGRAVAHLRAVDAAGELCVGAAFVRDGALEWSTIPMPLSAPGRPRAAQLSVGSAPFAPSEAAKVSFNGNVVGPGTFVVRVSRGTPTGSALFASAPALLAIVVSTTQNSARERRPGTPGSTRPASAHRCSASCAARNPRRSSRSLKPKRKPFRGTWRGPMRGQLPLRCRREAGATISRCSALPTTEA